MPVSSHPTNPSAATEGDERRYPDRPFVGVGVVVWRGQSVLLIKRGRPPRQGQWSLPGGVQQLGETVFEAARREVREETGLEIEVVDIVAVVDSIQRDDQGGVRYHYTLVDVLAEWRAGEARAQDDAADAAWTTLDELERFDLWDETVRVIGLAAERRE
jgi:ADP-ribose pyrophosphatase YjhB (NUDIX family)